MPTTLQIVPPEMLGEGQKQSTEKKAFDTQEFSPSKLADGEVVELRLLGNYSTGHMDFVFRCPVEERQPDGTLRFVAQTDLKIAPVRPIGPSLTDQS